MSPRAKDMTKLREKHKLPEPNTARLVREELRDSDERAHFSSYSVEWQKLGPAPAPAAPLPKVLRSDPPQPDDVNPDRQRILKHKLRRAARRRRAVLRRLVCDSNRTLLFSGEPSDRTGILEA